MSASAIDILKAIRKYDWPRYLVQNKTTSLPSRYFESDEEGITYFVGRYGTGITILRVEESGDRTIIFDEGERCDIPSSNFKLKRRKIW